MKQLRKRLTFANVVSCIALFLALGGAAYAAKTTLTKKSVKTRHLANGAVTTAKLRNGAVTTAKLRNGAVTSAKVRSGAIGSAQLADGGVRSVDIGGGVVTEPKIKNGAVRSGKLDPNLLAQLVRNVSYVNKLSAEDSEDAKSITAECPTGKQAIGGGARVNGELKEVALTGSNPFVSGDGRRTGWTATARESTETASSWSVEAFAICAEL